MNHNYCLTQVITALILLAGCASPRQPAPIVEARSSDQMQIIEHPRETTSSQSSLSFAKGSMILGVAASHVGVPYRYGGSDPSGFDCSGLVHYSHQNVGISVPRTAHDQSKAVRPVTMAELQPGDLIFFKQNFRRVSHVGIYDGKGRFIHAPNRGKRVTYTQLNDPYWSKRIARTGRFY